MNKIALAKMISEVKTRIKANPEPLLFIASLFAYGLFINIPATVFFNRSFTIYTIFSYGIVHNLIFDELVMFIQKTRKSESR